MDAEQITKELIPDFKAQVYYDPRTKIMFTVKREEGGKIVIGGASEYYDDAITSFWRHAISKEYFKQCEPISKDSDLLDKDRHGFLKLKGWGNNNDNHWYKYVNNNPEFTYLPETDKLVKANIINLGLDDMEDCLDDD